MLSQNDKKQTARTHRANTNANVGSNANNKGNHASTVANYRCPRGTGDARFRSFPAFTCDWCAVTMCLSCENMYLRTYRPPPPTNTNTTKGCNNAHNAATAAAADDGSGLNNDNPTTAHTDTLTGAGLVPCAHQQQQQRRARRRPPLSHAELVSMEATSAVAIALSLDANRDTRGAQSNAAAGGNGATGGGGGDGSGGAATNNNGEITAVNPFHLQPGERVPEGSLLKCHACNRGSLIFESIPLIPWVCAGPYGGCKVTMGADNKTVKRFALRNAFDPTAVQKYHANKDYRVMRTKSSHMIYADVIEGCRQPNQRGDGTMITAGEESSSPCSSSTSPSSPFILPPHITRGAVCVEGGSFEFRVTNYGPRQPCVWCAVSSSKKNEDRANGGVGGRFATQTITPIQRWFAPPTLPGVDDAVFTMRVPIGLWHDLNQRRKGAGEDSESDDDDDDEENGNGGAVGRRIHQLALYREAELYRVDLGPDGMPLLRINEATVSLPRTACAVIGRREAVVANNTTAATPAAGLAGSATVPAGSNAAAGGGGKGGETTAFGHQHSQSSLNINLNASISLQRQQLSMAAYSLRQFAGMTAVGGAGAATTFGARSGRIGVGAFVNAPSVFNAPPQGPLAVVTLLHDALPSLPPSLRPNNPTIANQPQPQQQQAPILLSDSPDIAAAVDNLLNMSNVAICGFGSKIDLLRAIALSSELGHKPLHELFCFAAPAQFQHNQAFLFDVIARRQQFLSLIASSLSAQAIAAGGDAAQSAANHNKSSSSSFLFNSNVMSDAAAMSLAIATNKNNQRGLKGGKKKLRKGVSASALVAATQAASAAAFVSIQTGATDILSTIPPFTPLRVTSNHQSNIAQLLRMVREELVMIEGIEHARAKMRGDRVMAMSYAAEAALGAHVEVDEGEGNRNNDDGDDDDGHDAMNQLMLMSSGGGAAREKKGSSRNAAIDLDTPIRATKTQIVEDEAKGDGDDNFDSLTVLKAMRPTMTMGSSSSAALLAAVGGGGGGGSESATGSTLMMNAPFPSNLVVGGSSANLSGQTAGDDSALTTTPRHHTNNKNAAAYIAASPAPRLPGAVIPSSPSSHQILGALPTAIASADFCSPSPSEAKRRQEGSNSAKKLTTAAGGGDVGAHRVLQFDDADEGGDENRKGTAASQSHRRRSNSLLLNNSLFTAAAAEHDGQRGTDRFVVEGDGADAEGFLSPNTNRPPLLLRHTAGPADIPRSPASQAPAIKDIPNDVESDGGGDAASSDRSSDADGSGEAEEGEEEEDGEDEEDDEEEEEDESSLSNDDVSDDDGGDNATSLSQRTPSKQRGKSVSMATHTVTSLLLKAAADGRSVSKARDTTTPSKAARISPAAAAAAATMVGGLATPPKRGSVAAAPTHHAVPSDEGHRNDNDADADDDGEDDGLPNPALLMDVSLPLPPHAQQLPFYGPLNPCGLADGGSDMDGSNSKSRSRQRSRSSSRFESPRKGGGGRAKGKKGRKAKSGAAFNDGPATPLLDPSTQFVYHTYAHDNNRLQLLRPNAAEEGEGNNNDEGSRALRRLHTKAMADPNQLQWAPRHAADGGGAMHFNDEVVDLTTTTKASHIDHQQQQPINSTRTPTTKGGGGGGGRGRSGKSKSPAAAATTAVGDDTSAAAAQLPSFAIRNYHKAAVALANRKVVNRAAVMAICGLNDDDDAPPAIAASTTATNTPTNAGAAGSCSGGATLFQKSGFKITLGEGVQLPGGGGTGRARDGGIAAHHQKRARSLSAATSMNAAAVEMLNADKNAATAAAAGPTVFGALAKAATTRDAHPTAAYATLRTTGQLLVLHSIDSLNAENLSTVAELLSEFKGRLQLLCSFDSPTWLSSQHAAGSGGLGGGGGGGPASATTATANGSDGPSAAGGHSPNGGGDSTHSPTNMTSEAFPAPSANKPTSTAANTAAGAGGAPHTRQALSAASQLATQHQFIVIPAHSKDYAFMPFIQETCHVSDAALLMEGGMAVLTSASGVGTAGRGGGRGGGGGKSGGVGGGGAGSALGGGSVMSADLSALSLNNLIGGGASGALTAAGDRNNSPTNNSGNNALRHPLQNTPMADTIRRVLLSLPQNFSEILRHILNLQDHIVKTKGVSGGGGRKRGRGGADNGLIGDGDIDDDDGEDADATASGSNVAGATRKATTNSASRANAKQHGISIHTIAPYVESTAGMLLTSHRLDAVLREMTSNRMATYDGATHSIFIPHYQLILVLLDELAESRGVGGAKK